MPTTTKPPPANVGLYTRKQAAAYLNLAECTLRRWWAATPPRGPRCVKMGTGRASRVRYPVVELAAFAADPIGYDAQTRRDNVPRFEPPSRGNPRHKKKGAAK